MSDVSKSVSISPAAAAAAGCSAQCPGVQTDYPDGWSREYTLSATEASGWRFVKFTWSKVRRTASGTTPIGDHESIANPSTAADGVAEARVYGDTSHWQEDLLDNIVAHFEQASYTVATAVTPAGSGTATGGGTFNSGATCTLTATASAGYTFTHWTDSSGTTLSSNATYSFTVSASDTYTAHFSLTVTVFRFDIPSATVYLNGAAENTRVGPGPGFPAIVGAVSMGATVTLNVILHDASFRFLNWTKLSSGDTWAAAGVVVATTQTASVVVTEPGVRYRANFQEPTHLLVNSYNRLTPVQLVYDPTTNLLVADY